VLRFKFKQQPGLGEAHSLHPLLHFTLPMDLLLQVHLLLHCKLITAALLASIKIHPYYPSFCGYGRPFFVFLLLHCAKMS
jgi:hypothetical protein